MRIRRLTVGLLTGLVALVAAFVAPSARAQTADCPEPYPPTRCGQLQVSATVVAAGASLTVAGSGFGPNTSITIELRSPTVFLANVTADGDGAFSLSVTIPADTRPGRYRLLATGRDPSGSPLTLATSITVASQNAAGRGGRSSQVNGVVLDRPSSDRGASGNLPRTGSSTAPLSAAAVGLVAVGSALLLVRRRRATSPASLP